MTGIIKLKNNSNPHRLGYEFEDWRMPIIKTALILVLCLSLLVLFVPVSASHSVSFEVDKPNSYYISSKDLITLTIKNTGQDTAYVSCGGMNIWQQPKQQNPVAQEINSCYVLQGANVAISYEIPAGQQHTWQWDQTYKNTANQNLNGQQVPNGKYFGEIVTHTDLKTGASATYTTSNFNVDSDSDNDGTADGADACPNDAKNQCNQPDADNDGVTDKLDPCQQDAKDSCADGDPDKDGIKNFEDDCDNESGSKETSGCPDSDGDGIADKNDKCMTQTEDKNGFKDDDGCPDGAQKACKDKLTQFAGGLVLVGGVIAFISLFVPPPWSLALRALAFVIGIVIPAIILWGASHC